MFKKIALVGIFALVSVVSFNGAASSANGATIKSSPVTSPTMRGFCAVPQAAWYGCPR